MNRVSFGPWYRTESVALGFALSQDTVSDDGKVKFREALAPKRWTRRLNKDGDWRVELIDYAGRIRAVLTYKPWGYAYTTFYCRYSTERCDPYGRSPSAVRSGYEISRVTRQFAIPQPLKETISSAGSGPTRR